MKRLLNRTMGLILAIALLVLSPLHTVALPQEPPQMPSESPYYILTTYDDQGRLEGIQAFPRLPRGAYFNDVTASLTIKSGRAIFTGSVSAPYQPVVFDVELQEKSGTSWIYTDSVSETYTEAGVNLLESSCYVVRGTYRTVSTATALRENGTPIKSLQAISPQKTY